MEFQPNLAGGLILLARDGVFGPEWAKTADLVWKVVMNLEDVAYLEAQKKKAGKPATEIRSLPLPRAPGGEGA